MRIFIVCFVMWIFVVPVLAGLILIFTFIAKPTPAPYFASTFGLAFSIVAIVWGPFCHHLLSRVSFHLFPRNRKSINFVQEKKHENFIENSVRS